VHRTSLSICRFLVAAALIAPLPAQAFDRLTFEVPGVGDGLRERVEAASGLRDLRDRDVTDPQEVIATARAEYARLLGAMYAEGRYNAVISVRVDGREAADLSPFAAPARVGTVTVRVDPGAAFRFGTARVAPLAPGTDLPEGFAPGERAGAGLIRQAAAAGVEGWRDTGHAKARPSGQRIVARHAERRLDAEVTLDPGPRLRFGAMTVTGNERVREQAVRRIAGYPEGEVYSPAALETAANRLRRTGAFRSVRITEAEQPNPDGTLDVILALAEERRRRAGAGVELNSLEGITLSAFFLHRNLTGSAERLRVDAAISGIGGQTGGFRGDGVDFFLGARATRPASWGPDTELFVLGEISVEDAPDFYAERASAGIGATRPLGEFLTGELALTFTHTRTEDRFGVRTFDVVAVPFTLTWDNRDSALDATSGFYARGTATPFLGIGGSASGVRLEGDARTYLRFGERLVLAARGQIGTVEGPSLFEIPAADRFFSGGGGTVRGQEFQSLGVQLTRGAISAQTGGASFLGASVEARVGVTDTIGVVAFYDWGFVSPASFFDFADAGSSHSGAGLGLRYDTGIGPIRLDVGVPVGGDGASFEDVQVYIGIGQAF
jgi:translocation and assembly module TamA